LILSFLVALLALVALLPIVSPLLRGSRIVPTHANFDQTVYRDQLHELNRDITRGLITQTEADAARLEIQRRMLAADKQPASPPQLARSPVLAGAVFLVIATGSISSYLWLGRPSLPDVPFSARKAEIVQDHDATSLQRSANALAAKLKQNPSDAQSWLLYARTLSMMNQFKGAEAAYRHAIDLGQTDPDVLGDHAEMLVMQAGGTVTPEAEAAFQQVLKVDPSNRLARYYMAIAALQAGEPRKTIDGLQALLAELPADSPLRGQLGMKVAEAARAAGSPVPELANGTRPTQAAAPSAAASRGKAMADATNITDEQRLAMVYGLVARLANEQAANPSNLEGWLRLGRAYGVLHDPEKAADAFDKAAALKPNDVSIPLQEVRVLLSSRAPTDRLPPRVIDLLKHVEATDPSQPMVLWYLGLAAAQDAHPDEARRYWNTLLTKVPAGSEDAKMIQSVLDKLSDGKAALGR
jgi:cytochrome c-type biogenesis protein CcmH